MQAEHRLKRITRLTALVIALAIGIAIPFSYFVTAYSYETRLLQDQADSNARLMSKLIDEYPETWQFQVHRMESLLYEGSWQKTPTNFKIVNSENKTLVHIGAQPPQPHHEVQAFLTDGIKQAGYIELQASLRPLLVKTALSLVISMLISISVYLALHILPFSILDRVILSLESSRQQLAKEVLEKQQALTECAQVTKALHYQASHDALTGFGNRSYFQECLARRIFVARKNQTILSVLLIDLNRFKEVNDALGHKIGDQVLVAAGQRISYVLSKKSILARLGSDEYAVLVSNTSADETLAQASAITHSLRSHIDINSYHLSISAAIGIAFYPQHGESQEKLLRHADIAMCHAKQNADDYCQYNKSYHANSPNRLSLTADLRHAIDNGWLTLHYQPKVCLSDGEIIGVEALARWSHPHHGYVSPDVFIPLAEQAGMINNLTEWLIRTALKQLAIWQDFNKHLSMAINISARNLQNENLPELIKKQLATYSIPPDKLTLEITESSIMIDPEKSRELINTLSQWGIHISIDDFGTGYSSLAYLKRLTVDELKIDRSFVRNMLYDQDDQIIVHSTIELAHNLHLNVVAEGVEDFSTYNILQEYGVDYVQGYYFCRPIPAKKFSDWLRLY